MYTDISHCRDAGVGWVGGGKGDYFPQFLANQLTLFQHGGAHYAHHISTSPSPNF